MKRTTAWLLVFVLILSLVPTAIAADEEAREAAEELFALGLFTGVGTSEDGTPDFDLDREPTRNEAVTMLVRLLGKEKEAMERTWDIPFTDVAEWAKPYVGYAYFSGLTKGTGDTTFGGSAVITATQYLTFVLRAMGYESGKDFQWNRAWELTDAIGLTDGRYDAESGSFLRGDVAIISRNALYVPLKDREETLLDALGLAPEAATEETPEESTEEDTEETPEESTEENAEEIEPKAWYETDENGNLFIRTNLDTGSWNGYAVMVRWNLNDNQVCHDNQYNFGKKVCFNVSSGLSWLYSMPRNTRIVSTEVAVLDDASLIDSILEMISSGVSFEDRVRRLSDHVKAQFVLDNRIHMEITEEAFGFTSFSLERNDDQTETYTAYIDQEITSKGEYGLVFFGVDGKERHSLSYIGKADGYLTFTRGVGHYGEPGLKGTFYITYCIHRMEENGEIICECAQSNGIAYTLK